LERRHHVGLDAAGSKWETQVVLAGRKRPPRFRSRSEPL
jgi:hypothetical protein